MADAEKPDLSGKLTFDAEKGAGRSKWIAFGLTAVLVGWMGSGFIFPSETDEPVSDATQAERRVAVAVIESQAEDVELVFSAEGQSEPDRNTPLRAETAGQVETVFIKRGDLVEAGQELARIQSSAVRAQLEQARAQLHQAQRDFDNAVALQDRGIATGDRVSDSRAALAAAEAQVTAAEEAVDNLIIRAPFAGRVNQLTLDDGEYVSTGADVGQILDNDPLTVVIQVPQQALSRLKAGQPAQVSFITGEELEGVVGFIGSNADPQTRTFRAEIIVDNPGNTLPAGLSAKVRIPTGMARGHFVSPAILSLGPSGELGIKTVGADDTVEFVPVSIMRAQTDGVWISGLPERAQIITVGQGFVSHGEKVDPREDKGLGVAETDLVEAQQ